MQHVAVWLVISISTFSVRIPLVLGGGANGLRLATHLRQTTSTRSTWWMPFYHAETKAEVPALMQRISEESEESETKKHAAKKIKNDGLLLFCVLGVWSQVFAHNFIKLLYSSHKPWLKWKCIYIYIKQNFEDVGIKQRVSTWKTWIFSGCGRMAEELGGDWGHCGSLHCCGQQGGTCELWLSGDARSSVLDDAPARGNVKEIGIRKASERMWFIYVSTTAMRLVCDSLWYMEAWKAYPKGLESMPNLKKATKSVEKELCGASVH